MILVTGGAGYIGSHLVMALLEKGEDVIVFDSLELGHAETIETLKKYGNLKFVKGNLKNLDEIRGAFLVNKIDSVVHFAAYSQVAESVKNPQKYYYNNVYGTLNLLNAMLEFGVKKIVFSSTAATYGEPVYTPIDEKHPQQPINPYGNSKLMVEKILDDYDKAYGLKSVRLRYFNVAGADYKARIGEWHEPETHLIPNVLKAKEDKVFKMFGTDYDTIDGTCVRDYINVEDLAQAHIKALEYLNDGGETNFFNLGTTEGNSVKEVFTACEEVKGTTIPLEICPRRGGDPATLVADNKKAKEILGWIPQHDLKDCIKSAYEWEKVSQ
ncbi:UDP-glucose 4-epimerase GalE [bacterium]|nr:UDP-glucose 4-epimerase GalE [bacterium]